MNVPNFLIIGAAKSGTTMLYDRLSDHSQVFASSQKEPRFFTDDTLYQRGLDWYCRTYFHEGHDARIRFEATPAYLTWSEKAAPRIADALGTGNVRFAVIFRDPVSRAYSHYWHRVRLGHERLSFEEALKAEPLRLEMEWNDLFSRGDGRYGYFRAGCYASRLQAFLDLFDRNNFFFLTQEDLASDRLKATFEELAGFLDIDPFPRVSRTRANLARRARSRLFRWVYWKAKKTPLATIYRNNLSNSRRDQVYNFFFPQFNYPRLDPNLEIELRKRYQSEVLALETIIGRKLTTWLP